MATKVATICINSRDDKERNIAAVVARIKEAAAHGADWVLLPEIFMYNGPYSGFADIAESIAGKTCEVLRSLAAELNLVVFAGSIHEHIPGDSQRVYNTLYVFGRDGQELAHYRKTHLFNLRDQDGQPLYCESDGFVAGDKLVSVMIDGMRVGLSICYDLRFSRLYYKLNDPEPCDVFVVPAAFTKATGEAHWEVLLRSRAIEFQAYVVAANQTGESAPGKACYGHSLVVDPWGKVLADTGVAAGIAYADLDIAMINEARAKLPALANQRPELYL